MQKTPFGMLLWNFMFFVPFILTFMYFMLLNKLKLQEKITFAVNFPFNAKYILSFNLKKNLKMIKYY